MKKASLVALLFLAGLSGVAFAEPSAPTVSTDTAANPSPAETPVISTDTAWETLPEEDLEFPRKPWRSPRSRIPRRRDVGGFNRDRDGTIPGALARR